MSTLLKLSLKVILLIMGTLWLASCGTLEVGVNQDAPTVQISATATDEPVLPTATLEPSPSATDDSAAEPAPTATELPPAIDVTPSSLWSTYRDPETGFGHAFPCHWLSQGRTLVSYDEAFFMDRAIRGHWAEGNPPDGAVKVEIAAFKYADSGVEPGATLEEAVAQAISDEIVATEMVVLGGKDALRVELPGTIYPDDTVNEIYFFPMSADAMLLLSVTPRSALDSPDVQGIINSLALAHEEQIAIPAADPQGALEGRQVLADVEAGYCFQFPTEYALEAYPPSGIPYLGDITTLKLERPFYTVGLTVTALPVGQQSILEELVTQFIQGLPDGAGEQVSRNPIERVGGVEFQIGNEPAEFLEGVPGTDGSREIFAKHQDRLYRLSFVPSSEINPQAAPDLETLFLVVTTSFSFLPLDSR